MKDKLQDLLLSLIRKGLLAIFRLLGIRVFDKAYVWDGIVKTEPLGIYEEAIEKRLELFANAKSGNWAAVFALMPDEPELEFSRVINFHITEPDDLSLNTLLHYAVLTKAPMDVVDRLIEAGASRTRRNAQGQRAVDLARDQGDDTLVKLLEPKLTHRIPRETIQQIERHFHDMIGQAPNDPYQLPQIEVLLEGYYPVCYFPLIGLYGGYRFWFNHRAWKTTLVTRFESRIVSGSAIVRKITVQGVEVVATGHNA